MMWGRPDTKSVIMFLESLILRQSIIIDCSMAKKALLGHQGTTISITFTFWSNTLANTGAMRGKGGNT